MSNPDQEEIDDSVVERTIMNECYQCVHRRGIAGSCHSACANPDSTLEADEHGIRNGWFNYPFNFDPVWKNEFCKNFEQKTE